MDTPDRRNAVNIPVTSDEADAPSSNRTRNLLIAGGVVLAVLIIAGAGFAWWFLRDDAPDEVAIDTAAAQVIGDDSTGVTEPDVIESDGTEPDVSVDVTEPDSAEPDTALGTTDPADSTDATAPATSGGPDTTERPADAAGIDGTWTVDTSIGEFSYEDSTGTFVGFRIAEELQGIGSTEAVGRTPEVAGTLTANGTTIDEVTIEADMGAITTNESRRDDNVWRALDTARFPTATFVLTEPIELGEGALAGEVVAVDAVGELTIHGVTRPVTFPLEAQLVNDTIVVVGSLDVVFADYDVEVPSAPVVISVDDHGPVELQLFFTR
jgi:polyisoprenoid-binding protein YceI